MGGAKPWMMETCWRRGGSRVHRQPLTTTRHRRGYAHTHIVARARPVRVRYIISHRLLLDSQYSLAARPGLSCTWPDRSNALESRASLDSHVCLARIPTPTISNLESLSLAERSLLVSETFSSRRFTGGNHGVVRNPRRGSPSLFGLPVSPSAST